MRKHERFHLGRTDFISAPIDEVLQSPHDDDIAGLVEPGQVAGVKPSLAPSIGAVIADIAVCTTGTATGQLARGFPRHIAAVRTDDAKFGSASRSSHGM